MVDVISWKRRKNFRMGMFTWMVNFFPNVTRAVAHASRGGVGWAPISFTVDIKVM